jgi:hypothetical protein
MKEKPNFTLRPVTDDDGKFIMDLFEETSERTLGSLPLPPTSKRQMLEMQLHARETGWRASNPNGVFQLILVEGERAGQWYINEADDQITLIYAALTGRFRGRGLISYLTKELMGRADESGKPLSAHVETGNPAREIWLHLSFNVLSDDGVYHKLSYCQ